MRRKCRIPGRNFCAPAGKIAALFVDIDGTCMKCEKYFKKAKRRFQFYMQQCGFDGAKVLGYALELELAHIHKFGFDRDALATSMVKAYRRAAREAERPVQEHILGICWDIGRSPYFRKPELFENCLAVLSRAQHNFYIVAVTIGDRDVQSYKIKQAGLRSIFDHIIITDQDNKSEMVARAIKVLKIDPKYSAFVGNSARSDGQCYANTNFIHMPLEGWDFDKAELPVDTGFELVATGNWRETEEKGINPLLLQRQVDMEWDEVGDVDGGQTPALEKRRGPCHNNPMTAPGRKVRSRRKPKGRGASKRTGKRSGRR